MGATQSTTPGDRVPEGSIEGNPEGALSHASSRANSSSSASTSSRIVRVLDDTPDVEEIVQHTDEGAVTGNQRARLDPYRGMRQGKGGRKGNDDRDDSDSDDESGFGKGPDILVNRAPENKQFALSKVTMAGLPHCVPKPKRGKPALK